MQTLKEIKEFNKIYEFILKNGEHKKISEFPFVLLLECFSDCYTWSIKTKNNEYILCFVEKEEKSSYWANCNKYIEFIDCDGKIYGWNNSLKNGSNSIKRMSLRGYSVLLSLIHPKIIKVLLSK